MKDIIISALQRRKLRLRDMKYVIPNHPAGKDQSRNLNSGLPCVLSHCNQAEGREELGESFPQAASLQPNAPGSFQTPAQ